MRDGCVFCDYDGPSKVLAELTSQAMSPADEDSMCFVIEPWNPVTEGHVLVIPFMHVADFRDDEIIAGLAVEYAALWASEHRTDGCNLIVSAGEAATQTVGHVHVHVVPRREGDGLLLPWSAPDAAAGFAAAIDLIDTYVSADDETMNPIRRAYRQIAP